MDKGVFVGEYFGLYFYGLDDMGCGVKGRKKVKFLFFCKCWNCVFCFEFGSEEFFCFVGYLNEV